MNLRGDNLILKYFSFLPCVYVFLSQFIFNIFSRFVLLYILVPLSLFCCIPSFLTFAFQSFQLRYVPRIVEFYREKQLRHKHTRVFTGTRVEFRKKGKKRKKESEKENKKRDATECEKVIFCYACL